MSDDLSWASAPLARIKAADEAHNNSSCVGEVQVCVKPLAPGNSINAVLVQQHFNE